MIKTYNQRFYPNPFRYRKINNITDQGDILVDVQNQLKPFLPDKFPEIHTYIDEFGEARSSIKVIKIIRERLLKSYEFLFNKSNFISRTIVKSFEDINKLENYNKNLRYLELPVHPLVDKKGFEIQSLTEDLVDEAIENIEEGFIYVYEYCANFLPETTELVEDHISYIPDDYPFVVHDDLLESCYEIYDTIFDDLQKKSLNLFNWTISGDLNSRLLKVVKSRFDIVDVKQYSLKYLFPLLKSFICFMLAHLILRYLILKLNSYLKEKDVSIYDIKKFLGNFKDEFTNNVNFKIFQLQQRVRKVLVKCETLNFRTKLKYKLLKLALK